MTSRSLRLTLLATALSTAVLTAQTPVQAPPNNYSPADDVQLGLQAAADAERQLPVLRDDAVTSYVQGLGERLVNAIPQDLRHPEFRYSFKVVNVREINAFALPGGPMFVNRGMIEAAHTEGEIAGVMAHELSHVVLRHGTAQASKASKYQIGEIAGAVLGSIIGGGWGQVVAQGTQFGLGAAFLRFSREYEHDADIEGAQLMARAGYDPRDMANVFKTIEQQSGNGGPQWLSDHPNPGNRIEYITAEARMLQVVNAVRDTRAFDDVRSHLRTLPKAPTTEEATRNAGRTRPTAGRTGTTVTGRVEPPSTQYRSYTEGDTFRVAVPANWRELADSSVVTFAPDGGFGDLNGRSVITHGVEIGLARNENHNLQTATDELIASLRQGNPDMSRPSRYARTTISGRPGLETTLTNRSDATGRDEGIDLYAVQLRDGSLLYLIGVAPGDAFNEYRGVFSRIVESLRLMD